MHPELTTYIQTQLALGISQDIIINDLSAQGGWPLADIEAAFAAIPSVGAMTVPSEPSEQYVAPVNMPVSIKYFEWLMYGSFLASVGFSIFQFISTGYELYLLGAMVVPIFWTLIKFICVYRIVYKRTEWARVVLTILFAFNIFSIFGIVVYFLTNPILLLSVIPVILEIFALYYLFTKSSTEWLTPDLLKSGLSSSNYTTENKKWTKIIPTTNHIFMVISVLLVFGLDLVILFSSPELAPFFIEMLVVFAIFVMFYVYELSTLKKKFSNSESRSDTWFVALVIIRNVVFVLNFIPFIQILGGIALIFGGIPYIGIYFFLLRRRKEVLAVTAVTG